MDIFIIPISLLLDIKTFIIKKKLDIIKKKIFINKKRLKYNLIYIFYYIKIADKIK